MILAAIDHANPACILALAGLMRIANVNARLLDTDGRGAETQHPVVASDVMSAAVKRAHQIQDWPADADEEWWRESVRVATQIGDTETLDTLSMLGSQVPRGEETWAHSRWRMIFGQQRWLNLIRHALEKIDESSIEQWLSAEHWPRDHYMGMTGVDCGAYTPAAYNWTSHTSRLSKGNPVSLWLMWEGLHAVPSVTGETIGWISKNKVRWPIWYEHRSYDWVRTVWSSSWLMEDDINGRITDDPDDATTARKALTSIGVSCVYEAMKTAQPPPYAYRLNSGWPL